MRMENKTLSKILFFSGLGMLGVFIVIRVITYHKTDIPAEITPIGDVKVEDSKLPEEKTKNEIIEEINAEKKKKEVMPSDENQYIQQMDLRKFTDMEEKKANQSIQNTTGNSKNYANTSPENSRTVAIDPYSKNKLKYKSEYFDRQKQNDPYSNPDQQNVATPQPAIQHVEQKSAFGTIKSGPSNSPISIPSKEYYSAQVYGDQKIMPNTALVVRNTEDMVFNNIQIQKNSIFYGIASFSGNRVLININKVKTANGEFPVKYNVMDNDRIEGIYNKAPIDEVLENSQDNTNINYAGKDKTYGGIVNSIAQNTAGKAKELMQKSRSLNLAEGYVIYLVAIKRQ